MDKKKSLPSNTGNADPVVPGIEALRPSATLRLHPLAATWKRLVSFFSLSEPLWTGAAAMWVTISSLLQTDTGLIWLGLAILFIPFLGRFWRGGYAAVRTPFDLPLGLFILGGAIGVWVSSQRELSWGAFYTLLADTLLYYSLVHYRYPGALIKVGFCFGAVALLLASLLAFGWDTAPTTFATDSVLWTSSWGLWLRQHLPGPPQFTSQPNLTIGTSHGLALALLIATALCAGLTAFGKRVWLRLSTGFGSLFFSGITLLFTNASLARLSTGESVKGRMFLWQETLDMLRDSPLTGAGLGMFASLHNSGVVPPYDATHPHNAYLQLYFDTGMLGAIALLLFVVIGVRLGWQILQVSRSNPWYGLGAGIVLALLASAVVGIVEAAPTGIPVVGTAAYFYVFSPLPWILAAIMVLAHRLLNSQGEKERGKP